MGTKQDFSGLKVGDGIWCTQPRLRNSEPEKQLEQLVVVKVARKYLTTQTVSQYKFEYIFEIATGREKDAGNYPRTLVLSPYQYEADRKRDAVWSEFRQKLNNMWSIEGVDEADIRTAAKLLNIDLT